MHGMNCTHQKSDMIATEKPAAATQHKEIYAGYVLKAWSMGDQKEEVHVREGVPAPNISK